MEEVKGKGKIYQIGNQFYYIEICFYNGIYEKPIFIPMNIVENISIKESLTNWATTGYITLQNDYQFLEKGGMLKTSTGEKKIMNNMLIVDRPDGRNKFCIRLYPVIPENTSLGSKQNEFIQKNLKDYEIYYDFVVYDVQDQPTENAEKKLKTYYLWEERYQLFLERNLEWSTALAAKKYTGITEFITDNDRKLIPNLALKTLLFDAANYPDGSQMFVGYSPQGKINEPEYFASDIIDEEWNAGPTDEDKKIFYTSFSNTNVIEDINYLLPYCSDNDGFPVLLTLGRTSEDKRFKLTSLKEIFDKSSENQKERLILADTKDAVTSTSMWKSRGPEFEDEQDTLKNFTSGQASLITSYQFCPMSNLDDRNLITTPHHYFDFSTGEFNIVFEQNKIEDLVTKSKEMVSGLINLQNGKNGQILLKNNKLKSETASIKNNYSAVSDIPKNIPSLQMLKDFVFLNQALVFETYGLTFRRPGNFMTVESIHSSDQPNDFFDKFLGQWLIVEVEHKFTKNLYSTVVTSNKVDAYDKVFDIEDSKYIA